MPQPATTPRGATESDRQLLRDLVGTVFRPSLIDEYPQLFHATNLPNCRVVEVDGALVSHVGMTVQGASIYGCRVRVACIGGVATHPDHRGNGYAGACLDDSIRVAVEAGVDFMMISGDRSLYRRAGCRRVGEDYSVSLSAEAAPPVPRDDVRLRDATEADIPDLRALHHAEPLHWERDPDTWRRALDCGWVMNRKSRFVLVEAGGLVVAYFIVPGTNADDGTAGVLEYAGDRTHLLEAFATFLAEGKAANIQWHVSGHDGRWRMLAGILGADVSESMTSGTYIVLNPPQLADRMRPYLRARLGERADGLTVAPDGDGFRVEGESLKHDLPSRGCVAHFLFGTREDRPTPAPASGPLADAFPLPALWYGVNYV